jgi:DNA-binding GntR family transcriptional regulator
MSMEDLHTSYAAHQRIIAAILSKKASAADQAMREHVLQSGRGMMAALEAIDAARSADRPRMRQRVSEGVEGAS